MTIAMMRTLDRLLGVPLCFLLTALRRLGNILRPARGRHKRLRRILLVKLAEQGATVLAYPAIRRACELVGSKNVYFLVFEDNRPIIDVMGVVPPGNIITVETKSPLSVGISVVSALWRIRKVQIDAAIDMEFFARSSAVLTYLSGARIRVGYHPFGGEAGYRGDLHTHRLSHNPHSHVAGAFLTMVEAASGEPEHLPAMGWQLPRRLVDPPQFRARVEETREARALLRSRIGHENSRPVILLNCNCSDMLPVRRWPPDRYVQLARRLLDRYPSAAVVCIGDRREAAYAEAMTRRVGSPRCISFAGKTSLRQLLVLYTLADVLVTNDSGPAHFASLTRIAAVTLFGPESPAVFGASGQRSYILWAALPCSPCVNAYNNRASPCSSGLCMERISVEDVFQKVTSVLSGAANLSRRAVASQ